MAISKQIFGAANTATFASTLQVVLEGTGIFDSVTVNDLVVDCVKNDVTLLSFNLGATEFVTVKNAQGTTLGSFGAAGTWGGTGVTHPSSISTCGSATMLIFSGRDTNVWTSIYIDKDQSNNFVIASVERSQSVVCRSASESSISFDTAYGISAPLSTSYTNASLYKATAQTIGGEISVFENVYGIRFSPAMHATITPTTADVTPSTIIINGTTYITDGYACIADT